MLVFWNCFEYNTPCSTWQCQGSSVFSSVSAFWVSPVCQALCYGRKGEWEMMALGLLGNRWRHIFFILSDAKWYDTLTQTGCRRWTGWGNWEDLLETLTLEMIGTQIQCPLCIFRIPIVLSPLLGQATVHSLQLLREETTVLSSPAILLWQGLEPPCLVVGCVP